MKRLAVIGMPVAHSRSPAIHNAAFEELGMAEEWSYEAVEVAPDQFGTRVREMIGEGFAGANVTVPYKSTAMLFAHRKSEVAREIGAANTLSFGAEGTRAENTDASGLLAALPQSPAGTRALVLGAGGSARACVWALREAGAHVSVWNRTTDRAQRLAAEFGVTPVPT